MITKIKKYLKDLSVRLLDADAQTNIVKAYTYIALGVVSLFMTLINVITGEIILGISTGVFAAVCLTNLSLHLINKKTHVLTDILFGVSVILFFTFFIVFGYPQGFSIIWIALLPPIALLFYGTKKGCIITGVMFLILIFFLWTPIGVSLLQKEAIYAQDIEFAATFRLRFPFLCMGSLMLSLILQMIKDLAYKELTRMNKINLELSHRDSLTGLYNRTGMRLAHDSLIQSVDYEGGYFEIFDIDLFKKINDKYGHIAGDYVIKEISLLMNKYLPGIKCRYGGDEFAIFCIDSYFELDKFTDFVKIVNEHHFEYEGKTIKVSISAGIYKATKEECKQSDESLRKADIALYKSKQNGRNQLSIY